jgi:hypothetical protein
MESLDEPAAAAKVGNLEIGLGKNKMTTNHTKNTKIKVLLS